MSHFAVPTRLPSLFPKSTPVRALAAAMAVAAGLVAATAQASPAERAHEGHRMHAGGAGPAPHRGGHDGAGGGALGLSPRLLEQVQATPEQREKIRGILSAARAEMQAQREAHRGLRQRSLELLGQPELDTAAFEALRKDMLAQHERASQRQMQALLEAGRVLTPEQRKRLAEVSGRHRDMMERHHRERRALDAPKS